MKYGPDSQACNLALLPVGCNALPRAAPADRTAASGRGVHPGVIPGVGLHEELELLVAAGIPPLDVLRIATRTGTETLGLLDEIGTVEVGKRADLVVLGADPTADVRNTRSIELIIQNGRTVRPAEILNELARLPGLLPEE